MLCNRHTVGRTFLRTQTAAAPATTKRVRENEAKTN